MGATRRNRIVNGQDSSGEFRTHLAVKPGPQTSPLSGVSTPHAEYEFHDIFALIFMSR
jgi:hypothetical protein